MTLEKRLLQRYDTDRVVAILGILANPGMFQPVLELDHQEEITVSRGHRPAPGHEHLYGTEIPSLAGEGNTPIGQWERGTHTLQCACGDTIHADYRAQAFTYA